MIDLSCLLLICLLPPLRAFYSSKILTSSSSCSNRLRCFKTMSCSSREILVLSILLIASSMFGAILTLVARRSRISSSLKSGSSIALRMHLHANSSILGEASTAEQTWLSCTRGLFTFSPSQNSNCSFNRLCSFSTCLSPSVTCFVNWLNS